MKHFFSRKESIVTDALDGLLRTSPPGRLARLDTYPDIKIVLRADWDRSKVAVISGGGAGHEPSHAGFVGQGLLTAAVSGEIFASPSVEAVLTAIRAVTGPRGCLLIVKNYTGDRLNFGLAAEKARAEGLAVEMAIVADDIALPDIAHPRGIAGTLFVHKIAGHLAESGADLSAVAEGAAAAARSIVSLGVSYSTCSIPGQPHEARLGEDEGELGLGIHGEPGAERIAVGDLQGLVARMTAQLQDALSKHSDREDGNLALLINNLGAVPPLEMGVIANTVLSSPLAARIKLVIGPAPLMTALNMNGFSLSLLALDAEREAALRSAVAPHAWVPAVDARAPGVLAPPDVGNDASVARSDDPRMRRLLTVACERLIASEAELNRLDAKVGDGDTGSTMATGARSVLAQLDAMPLADTAATMAAIGRTLGTAMGGSSGVLLSIFFTAAAQSMAQRGEAPAALLAGLERMSYYGGAKPGDRTLIDALDPALRTLAAEGTVAASAAARVGADATRAMRKARAGRASYVGERDLDGVPDPGAMAVAVVFDAIAGLAD